MKSPDLIQIEVQRGTSHKIVWVDNSWNLKKGNRISFIDDYDDGVSFESEEIEPWVVLEVYKQTKLESQQIFRKWGLDLPKSQRTER